MAPNLPPVTPSLPPTPLPAVERQQTTSTPETLSEELISPTSAPPEESVTVQPLAGSAEAPVVPLVDETPDLKAHGESLFASKLAASSKSYLKADNPRLAAQLKEYAALIEQKPEMKLAIGRNPRGLDFLHVLEKASKGQKLNRDDVEDVQLFLTKDTRFGSALSYSGDPNGVDGKFGVRTLGTLDHFINHFQPSDLVADPYYDRLDKEGVAYARLQPGS